MNAVGYARVSTQEQALTGSSIHDQIEQIEAYAKARGWTLVGILKDEGVSGAAEHRPGLNEIGRLARDRSIQTVIVTKLDRGFRNLRHLLNWSAEMDSLGVDLVSISESVDTSTPAGRMLRSMLGAFAEFERERITERMASGLRMAARAGRFTGGAPPFGFRPENGRLVIDEREAEVIREAVRLMVDEGLSAYQAAARLNAQGLTPRRADAWRYANLRRTMESDALRGVWRYGKYSDGPVIEVEIPRIISESEWKNLRKALRRRSSGQRSTPDRDYLLSGLVTSPCGSTYWGTYRPDRGRSYFRCRMSFQNEREPGVPSCGCPGIPVEDVDAVVWSIVVETLSDADRLRAYAAQWLES